jgi:hypothetical protein
LSFGSIFIVSSCLAARIDGTRYASQSVKEPLRSLRSAPLFAALFFRARTANIRRSCNARQAPITSLTVSSKYICVAALTAPQKRIVRQAGLDCKCFTQSLRLSAVILLKNSPRFREGCYDTAASLPAQPRRIAFADPSLIAHVAFANTPGNAFRWRRRSRTNDNTQYATWATTSSAVQDSI